MTAPSLTSTNLVENDSPEARILDAALIQFGKVGVKKTTIEDIARTAGVDRVTVYRRVGSRDDVVRSVFGREVTNLLAELLQLPERHDDIADLVADILITVMRAWRTNVVAQQMMSLEPERVLPQLAAEGSTGFTMSVAATTTAFESAAERGLLPHHSDMHVRAEIVCRIVQSMILSPSATVSVDSDNALDQFARLYLTPIVTG